jgi:aspartate-semialdehyde dehydrogenase
MNVAIVGASGQVGRKMISVLEKSEIKVDKLFLYTSKRSSNNILKFKNKEYKTIELCKNSIDKSIDIALFSAGASVSKEFASLFTTNGTFVIDNSSAFRSKTSIPLVVSEVNAKTITKNTKIIANPNCTTMAIMPVLDSLNKKYVLKRLVVSSYQAVSGSGRNGVFELINQVNKLLKNDELLSLVDNYKKDSLKSLTNVYEKPIAFNAVAFAGDMLENGYTSEEMKLVNETRRILNIPKLQVTGTCVRIPVFTSHSLSVNAEFKKPITVSNAENILKNCKNIVLDSLPNPLEATGKNDIFVGRIRNDESQKNTINLWVSADNLLKGAALNAVQIAEYIYKNILV